MEVFKKVPVIIYIICMINGVQSRARFSNSTHYNAGYAATGIINQTSEAALLF
jgi:hypothetical protein